jgi:hypothetical protein
MKVHAVIIDLDGTLTKPFLNFDQIRSEMGLSSSSVGILEAMEKMSPEQRHQAMAILDRHESDAARNALLNERNTITGEVDVNELSPSDPTRNTRKIPSGRRSHNLTFDAICGPKRRPVNRTPSAFKTLRSLRCRAFRNTCHRRLSARPCSAVSRPLDLMRTHPGAEFENQAHYSIDRLETDTVLLNTLNK